MKTQKAIGLLLGIFLSVSAFAENLDKSTAAELVDRIADAQHEGDFSYLAEVVHPRALEYFRRTVLIRFDHIENTFSAEDLDLVLGMKRAELEQLSDEEFFKQVCQRARNIEPGLGRRTAETRLVILGVVQDGRLFHALFRSDQSLASDSDTIVFNRPLLLTFIWSNNQWQLYSIPYGEQVSQSFYYAIARNAE